MKKARTFTSRAFIIKYLNYYIIQLFPKGLPHPEQT